MTITTITKTFSVDPKVFNRYRRLLRNLGMKVSTRIQILMKDDLKFQEKKVKK